MFDRKTLDNPYLRVLQYRRADFSDEAVDELKKQAAACAKYRFNWFSAGQIEDIGPNTTKSRPGLSRLISMVSEGQVDAIYVVKLDILWEEDPEEWAKINRFLSSNKVMLITYSNVFQCKVWIFQKTRFFDSFEFEPNEFGGSLENIKPLLAKFGVRAENFRDIAGAVRHLNVSRAPFDMYLNDVKTYGTDKEHSRLFPKDFETMHKMDSIKWIKTADAQKLKREIIKQLYPQESSTREIVDIVSSGEFILSGLIKNGILLEISATEVCLNPDIELESKEEDIREIAKEYFDKTWVILQKAKEENIWASLSLVREPPGYNNGLRRKR